MVSYFPAGLEAQCFFVTEAVCSDVCLRHSLVAQSTRCFQIGKAGHHWDTCPLRQQTGTSFRQKLLPMTQRGKQNNMGQRPQPSTTWTEQIIMYGTHQGNRHETTALTRSTGSSWRQEDSEDAAADSQGIIACSCTVCRKFQHRPDSFSIRNASRKYRSAWRIANYLLPRTRLGQVENPAILRHLGPLRSLAESHSQNCLTNDTTATIIFLFLVRASVGGLLRSCNNIYESSSFHITRTRIFADIYSLYLRICVLPYVRNIERGFVRVWPRVSYCSSQDFVGVLSSTCQCAKSVKEASHYLSISFISNHYSCFVVLNSF